MSSFKSNENIHKKEDGPYYVVSANKAPSVTEFLLLGAISEKKHMGKREGIYLAYLYRRLIG